MMGRGAALLDNGDTSMSQTDQECQALKPMINHWLQPQGWPGEVREWGRECPARPTAATPPQPCAAGVAGCPEGKAGDAPRQVFSKHEWNEGRKGVEREWRMQTSFTRTVDK